MEKYLMRNRQKYVKLYIAPKKQYCVMFWIFASGDGSACNFLVDIRWHFKKRLMQIYHFGKPKLAVL